MFSLKNIRTVRSTHSME